MATARNRQNQEIIIIKKYANRRLYNTDTSSYITLEDLGLMVRDGVEFQVVDAKTGNDLTKDVLTQIIVAEESKGQNLLPVSFLREVIKMYGDNMQWMVPKYLEASMSNFSENQERVRNYMRETFGTFSPLDQMDAVSQQNAQFFDQAMQMFSPFGQAAQGDNRTTAAPDNSTDIKSQLDKLQKELDAIKNRKD